MNKAGRQPHSRAPRKAVSLAIPLVAGVVVLFVVVGAILSLQNRQGVDSSLPGGAAVPGDTALPLPTRSIPYPDVPRIPVQEAWGKLEQGIAVLVDVRSRESYEKVHAAGAISIPEDEVQARLGDLPRDRSWILYCT